jgi:hypothetical protein
MAPAEVMSDRLCIQTDGRQDTELSPYELMACVGDMSEGCEAGRGTYSLATSSSSSNLVFESNGIL